ncbi:hypothetical protein TTHERM_000237349 (macronuclear) [Tetrahymena thermophila SB210]|uniref:Uncharacterized protein n=1 Tax=Tetrahymena thermophila (strain SB210) TaxID=312017 RepID=W7WY25_TETTS|nr:hypothetical protein TTHERM_000237349 [Tetrahymena thermophila SB210]EWS71770.1 hypothetical protein TTHERM_000237349 [Tetrahymena thermophila SB210]|eukprot:XP_012655657.1 hypothetical protein TTHERM_000237349 [Tetrahymena thermophila SB210]
MHKIKIQLIIQITIVEQFQIIIYTCQIQEIKIITIIIITTDNKINKILRIKFKIQTYTIEEIINKISETKYLNLLKFNLKEFLSIFFLNFQQNSPILISNNTLKVKCNQYKIHIENLKKILLSSKLRQIISAITKILIKLMLTKMIKQVLVAERSMMLWQQNHQQLNQTNVRELRIQK